MAGSGLTNSRNALIFAGGVIVCAVFAASTLGSQFTPGNGAPGDSGAMPQPPKPPVSQVAPEPQPTDDESVFGDYQAFSDDELIDDTSGFDPMSDDDQDDFDYAPIDNEEPQVQADGVASVSPAPTGAPAKANRTPRRPSAQPRPSRRPARSNSRPAPEDNIIR